MAVHQGDLSVFIGIDLGTSAVKAVLVDDSGRVVTAMAPLHPATPRPGWSEDDPQSWWDAADAAMRVLRNDYPDLMARAQGIGLSGQMHACLLLDAADHPVRPAMLWNDGRSVAEARRLSSDNPFLAARLGVPAAAGFTGPKIAWLRSHEPAALDRAATLLLPKDALRLRLTGERATDPSDAAGTWLFDQADRRWSPEALSACGADPRWLPPLAESGTIAGHLRPAVALRWGVPSGLPVACGGGDTAVGGVGIGATQAGDGFISLGTSAQLFVADAAFNPAPEQFVHAFCHAAPDRWYAMAALLNGASPLAAAVAWTGGGADIAAALRRVEAGYTGPGSLLALPYLAGERTPHDDPHASGCLVGLTAATTADDIVLAVLEGVAFSLADGADALRAARSLPPELGLIGGGARSSFWAGLIASILGVRLVRYRDAHHGPALGAARLARLAVTGEPLAAMASKPATERVFKPDPRVAAAYAPRLEAFRSLYRALAPEFRRAAPG